MSACPHLSLRKNGIYYFRIKIPKDLANHFPGKAEFRQSLKTKNKNQAKVSANTLTFKIDKLFLLIRSGIICKEQIDKIVAQDIKSAIEFVDTGNLSITVTTRTSNSNQDNTRIQSPVNPNVSPTNSLKNDTKTEDHRLSAVLKEFIEENLMTGNWTDKTLQENESIIKLFIQIVGDRCISEIQYSDLRNFRQILFKLPSNINKKKQFKGTTIQQIVEMKPSKTMSRTTINKYLSRVSSLYNFAIKNNYTETNQAAGLTVANNKKPEEFRDPYSSEDLQKIFGVLSQYHSERPERLWIPLIAIFSGMRLNEICQLYIDDIKLIDNIYCFDINEKNDKRLKNISSKRYIPIHPTLIEFGIIPFWNSLKSANHIRLWPNLSKGRDGYGHAFGMWYQRFNRNNIVREPRKVFHSFRHNFIDNLKQKEVGDIIIAEIVGHKVKSITTGRYGKHYKPDILVNAIKKLDYGIDLKKIKSSIKDF